MELNSLDTAIFRGHNMAHGEVSLSVKDPGKGKEKKP